MRDTLARGSRFAHLVRECFADQVPKEVLHRMRLACLLTPQGLREVRIITAVKHAVQRFNDNTYKHQGDDATGSSPHRNVHFLPAPVREVLAIDTILCTSIYKFALEAQKRCYNLRGAGMCPTQSVGSLLLAPPLLHRKLTRQKRKARFWSVATQVKFQPHDDT